MRQALTRPRPRAAGVLVMLVLHAGLLAGLWSWSRGSARPAAQAQAPLTVRLLGLRPLAPGAAESQRPRQPPTPVRAAATAPAQAITLPAAADSRTTIMQSEAQPQAQADVRAAAPAPPAPASSPASAPLDLKLRAGARQRPPAQAALDDPRANTPRATLDSRIAAVLGGNDAFTEEHLADGSVRFRRGTSCVVSRPNRAQAIDPFNGSVAPKPRLIDSC